MRRGLIIGATVLTLAAGCGDQPGTGELGSIGTGHDEAGLREAVRAYLDAWSAGNTEIICGLLDSRTATEFAAKVRAADCPAAVHVLYDRMSDQVRSSFRDVQLTEVKVRGENADHGDVEVSAKVAPFGNDTTTSWTYRQGRWQVRERPHE
ncbi:hypothetical protein ILP97_14775 [Amycolatopsis sp. H6(2020)]|nr:hypothetical protein [Amycolatopsis sp. H6(2020)]